MKSPFSNSICDRVIDPRTVRKHDLCKTRGDQEEIRRISEMIPMISLDWMMPEKWLFELKGGVLGMGSNFENK